MTNGIRNHSRIKKTSNKIEIQQANSEAMSNSWNGIKKTALMKQKENLGSFILLAAQPSKLVGDNYIELGSSLHNLLPLSCGHIMCNLSTVSPEIIDLEK